MFYTMNMPVGCPISGFDVTHCVELFHLMVKMDVICLEKVDTIEVSTSTIFQIQTILKNV